ncbi:MAG: putative sulfate exporter family transporter [Desertifilum sp. SIO1I2]|nr:putative sulfate exporter family transporter [Desertifilum sp. SIO1I2]
MEIRTQNKARFSLGTGEFKGIFLAGALAAIAILFQQALKLEHLSPLILVILLGNLVRNPIGVSFGCQPGIQFCLKRILRLAIILLGLRLSLAEVIAMGGKGLAMIGITLVSTFFFICWLGSRCRFSYASLSARNRQGCPYPRNGTKLHIGFFTPG